MSKEMEFFGLLDHQKGIEILREMKKLMLKIAFLS